MTDTATRQEQSEQAHDFVDSEDMGGSPESEDNEEVGAEDDQQDSGADQSQERSRSAEEYETLERQFHEAQLLLAQVDDRIQAEGLASRVYEGKTEDEGDWYADAETTIREGLEGPAADVVLKAFGPALARLADLEKRYTNDRSKFQRVAQSVGRSEFTNALANSGVSPSDQQSKGFQKTLRSLRANRSYQSMESRDPQAAADWASAKWQAETGKRNGFSADRDRVAAAKTGKGARGARPAGLAEKVIEITRGPGDIDRAHKARMKAMEAGKDLPTIRYVSPTK
jgi:hypothetical protein